MSRRRCLNLPPGRSLLALQSLPEAGALVCLRSVVGSLWKILPGGRRPPLQPPPGLDGSLDVGTDGGGLAGAEGHSRCPAASRCERAPWSLFCAATLLGCCVPGVQHHPGGCLQNLGTEGQGGNFLDGMVEQEAFYSSGSSSSGNADCCHEGLYDVECARSAVRL